MKVVEITLEVLTPMFSFGDDSKKDSIAEFRITELKSLMRSTFRELYYFKDEKTMKEKETNLFGNIEKKSPVSFKAKSIRANKEEKYEMLPHRLEENKRALTSCLSNSKKINFFMIINNTSNLELYIALLIQSSIIGSLGKRSRKGFGSFKVSKVKVDGNDKYNDLLNENPIEILKNLEGLLQSKEYKLRNSTFNSTLELNVKNNDNKLDYPYVKKITALKLQKDQDYLSLIKNISELTHDRLCSKSGEDFIDEIYNNGEINRNILGNCKYQRKKINRFASPIYVTFSEHGDSRYLVIKELNYKYILEKKLYIKSEEAKKANKEYVEKYIEELIKIGKGKR